MVSWNRLDLSQHRRLLMMVIMIVMIALPIIWSNSVDAQSKKRTGGSQRAAVPAKPTTVALAKLKFETVALDAQGKVTKRDQKEADYFSEALGKGVTLEMVRVPGGSFQMGSTAEQAADFKREIEKYCPRCDGDEQAGTELPQHRVTVPTFFMGKIEVTQAQWRAFIVRNPSNFKKGDLPVENISWDDAVKFCQLLSKKTGRNYRLPTEAEWEYACRAGSTSQFAFGDTLTHETVNYDSTYPYGAAAKGEYRETTLPGGQLGVANAFGIYDLHGNVYEWCADVWHENYQGAPTDGSAWLVGGERGKRVLRGGAWDVSAYNCRSAYRLGDFPDKRGIGPSLGFRVVCDVPAELK